MLRYLVNDRWCMEEDEGTRDHVLQFWKSVQVIKQKHKSNYNCLNFLIYLLHILRSISTDFSLLH